MSNSQVGVTDKPHDSEDASNGKSIVSRPDDRMQTPIVDQAEKPLLTNESEGTSIPPVKLTKWEGSKYPKVSNFAFCLDQ